MHTANKIISSWCDKNTIAIDKTTFTNPVKQHTHYMEQLDRVRVYIMENVVDQKVEEAIRGDLLSFGCAKLDRTEKENIHSSLQKIRQIIEQSQLPDKKKNALFQKFNALAEEVDRVGTRTDAFFGLLGDLGIQLGQFGENAKPMTNEIKSILRIIMRSRARAEDVALPKTADFPLLDSTRDEVADD